MIEVKNIQKADGQICIAVYREGEDFLSDNAFKEALVPVNGDEQQQIALTLPAGTYAISLFHDINGNSKLDANFFGIPKEPYGFSNDAKGKLGPPKFEQCTFDVPDTKILTIHLK